MNESSQIVTVFLTEDELKTVLEKRIVKISNIIRNIEFDLDDTNFNYSEHLTNLKTASTDIIKMIMVFEDANRNFGGQV